MDTTIRAQEAIPARIDRLPVSREIWGIMLLAGVAWLVESYDVGVIGSVLPSLQKEFQLGAFSVGLLAIASTLGIVIGVIPAGWMADSIGRKKILIIPRIAQRDCQRGKPELMSESWSELDVAPVREGRNSEMESKKDRREKELSNSQEKKP